MYDEFDLRPYLAALRRYWRHLAGFVLLSTLVTTALVFLLPARYEATAGIAIVRAVSDINPGTPVPAPSPRTRSRRGGGPMPEAAGRLLPTWRRAARSLRT